MGKVIGKNIEGMEDKLVISKTNGYDDIPRPIWNKLKRNKIAGLMVVIIIALIAVIMILQIMYFFSNW